LLQIGSFLDLGNSDIQYEDQFEKDFFKAIRGANAKITPMKKKLPPQLTDLGELMSKKHPVLIAREDIIDEMIEVMMMYDLPNPVLVGQAGSGKTAIVEYLAYLMNQEQIDKKLCGKEILRLDLQSQMANTSYVGQTETKFNELYEAVKERDAWVYVDETHALVGAGSSSKHDNDIPNMLKPHLQNGTIRMIGSTTPEEFKVVEAQSAFNRRLERINVPPLNKLQIVGVINGIRPKREQHYGVQMPVDYAVQIADGCEKIVGHSPAKEIKVLDRAFVKAERLGASQITTDHIEYALKKQMQEKTPMGF
jgi:ATP-dependent Clp protease ATP-binding subunit ClpE